MAADLRDSAAAREMLDVARECSLDLDALLDADEETLRRTENAQPALLFVECALHAELAHDLHPGAVAGHSVGEYSACVAAGALTRRDAMRLVIARGRAMAAMRAGTMRALLGVDAATAAQLCADVQRDTGETVVVANDNAPGQIVISGTSAGIDAVCERAAGAGLRRAVPLNVGGAFHSPLMEQAAREFAVALDSVELHEPHVPIVCNVDAQPVRDAAGLRERLSRQLTAAVRWVDCVRTLLSLGADELIEVGPGSVLTGLARRIAPGVAAVSVSTPDTARSLATRTVTS